MSVVRRRPTVSFTLSPETKELLRRSENASEYVDRLVRAYPPPRVRTLTDLGRLVQSRHPWVMSDDGQRARDGLPTFGGLVPIPAAASWSKTSVMDWDGIIIPRSRWERRSA